MMIIEDDDEEEILQQPMEEVVEEPRLELVVDTEPKFLKSTSVQLGDIISFVTQNPIDNMNNLIFYVTYIDANRIQLKQIESSSTNYSLELQIRENHHVFHGENKIPTWRLLYRNKYPGFAKQNNLIKGTWVDIQFDVSTPNILITGEIVDVIEDMIVLNLYNGDNKRIYINFNYSGLPPDLHIVSIKLREKPRAVKFTEQKAPSPMEVQGDEGETGETGELEVEGPTIAEQVRDADRLFNRIIIMKDVENKFRPERLLNQVDDLMNSIIITETEKLNNQNLTVDNIFIANKAQKMVERFIQLREQFTKFNNDKVVIGPLIKSEKPLLSYFLNFSTSLYWIMPAVTNVKKAYDNNLAEEEGEEVEENMVFLEQSQYRENLNESQKLTSLETYDKQISDILRPFEETENEDDYLIELPTNTDITTLVSNIESKPLFTKSYGKADGDSFTINDVRFSQLKYNLGLTGLKKLEDDLEEKEKKNYLNRDLFHTDADKMQLVSFVTLPESVIEFSRVNLPYSSILLKSNYSLQPFACWKLLNMETQNITNVDLNADAMDIEEVEIELETPERRPVKTRKTIAYDETENTVVAQSNITNYVLQKPNSSNIDERESVYKKCVNQMIPSMTQLFQKMQPFMNKNVKMSIIDTISYLEPFLMYSDDITFALYSRIKEFLRNEIDEYIRHYYKKQLLFAKFPSLKPQWHITDFSLAELIPATKGDRQEVLSSYDLLPSDTLLNSDIYNQIIQLDYARLFCSSIAESNSKLLNISFEDENILSLENQNEREGESKAPFQLRKEIIENKLQTIQALNEKMELAIQNQYQYNLNIISKLISIEKFEFLKNNNDKVAMSMETKVNEPIDSPSKRILDLILQQKSDILRNYNLKRFKEEFLREPNYEEKANWLYAKTVSESQPLLPQFVYEMAVEFITARDLYPAFLDTLLVRLKAKLSGDNKYLVDPATGWKIVERAYVEENLTYKIDEPSEEDLELEKEQMYEVKKKQHDPYEEALYRETNDSIKSVIVALLNQFSITFIAVEQITFIINEVNRYLDNTDFVKTEKMFLAEIEKENKKEKRDKTNVNKTYEEYKQEKLLYTTVTLFFIALQTSIPAPIRKNSVPTCTFSFAGYPLEEGNNYQGMDYIACGVGKMKMSSGIWHFVTRQQDKFRERMIKITKDLLSFSLNVIHKIESKRKQIISGGLEIEKSNREKEALRQWNNFLPPSTKLQNISRHPQTISPEFKRALDADLKHFSDRQLEEISVAESKIFQFSLSIQKAIEDVVLKETEENTGLLLKSLAEKVYTANACCQSVATDSVLDYFNSQTNGEITSTNNQVNSITSYLSDIVTLSQATTFFSELNTKIIFPPIPTEFSESTAFKAFIHYFQLRSPALTVFLDDDIKQLINLELPYAPEGLKLSLNQVYTMLKEDGKYNEMITGEKLKILLKIVSSKNMIKKTETVHNDCEHNVTVILEEDQELRHTPEAPLETLLSAYLKDSTEQSYKALYNFLEIEKNKLLEANKNSFANMKIKDKTMKSYFSSNATTFIKSNLAVYQRVNFIKNFITNMVNVYPTMIINGVKREFKPSPSMKKESGVQAKFIEKLLQNSNDNILKKFTHLQGANKKVCDDILKLIRESHVCQLIRKLSQDFPIQLNTNDNDEKKSAMHREIIIMLFDYFVLEVMSQYVEITKSKLRPNEKDAQTFFGNLLREYMIEFVSYGQEEMTFTYETINEETFIATQDEKHLFLRDIQKMDDEQLEIYKMYKKVKKNKEVRFFDPKTFMEDLDRKFAIDELRRQRTIEDSNVIVVPENPVIFFNDEDGADYGNDGNDQNMDMDMND